MARLLPANEAAMRHGMEIIRSATA
jgi:hypothetical protein